jgi:hypothetical protein
MNITELATAIARHLDGWRVCTEHANEHHATLRRDDLDDPDVGFFIRQEKRKRIAVHGIYPQEFYRWEESPRITCSATRAPESIAGDIMRRFLPDYYQISEGALRQRYRQRRSDRLKRAALDRLAKMLNAQILHADTNNPCVYSLPGDARRYRIRAYPHEVGTSAEEVTVNLELDRISMEDAVAICKILAE